MATLEDLPELVLRTIFFYLHRSSQAKLRCVSKWMDYQVTKQEGASYFNNWRIIPYQHRDLIDKLNVVKAAQNRNPERMELVNISLDFGHIHILSDEEDQEIQKTVLDLMSSCAFNTRELRLCLYWKAVSVFASQVTKCDNLEYLWLGGDLIGGGDKSLINIGNSELMCSKLLEDHSSSLVKLDLWDVPNLHNKSTFSCLQMLRMDQICMEQVLNILQLCQQTIKFLCISNSTDDSSLIGEKIYDKYTIRLPHLKNLILCNSAQAYLDVIVLKSLTTLQTLELIDYLIPHPFDADSEGVENVQALKEFENKICELGGFKELAHLRVDSNHLEFLITEAADTLSSLVIGFKELKDPFRPPSAKLPQLEDLYFSCNFTEWTRQLIINSSSHLKSLRIQHLLPDFLNYLDSDFGYPSLEKLVFHSRYKKYFNFESQVKLEEKFNRLIFGNWQEMYIFPRYSIDDICVWTGPDGPYGPIGQEVPIMRIVND